MILRLLRLGPDAFTEFIDILIETKQNDNIDLLSSTTWKFIYHSVNNSEF